MTVSGIARFGSVDSIGGATFAVFDVPTAQSLLNKEGQFDVIYVTPKSGVSEAEVADQVKPLLPSSAQIETGDAAGKAAASEVNDGLAFFQYLLLAFAGIALIVGSFVIFNTLSMTVASAGARAGHAAHARRVAQAGVPLGAARGLRHRAVRRDRRPARSAC